MRGGGEGGVSSNQKIQIVRVGGKDYNQMEETLANLSAIKNMDVIYNLSTTLYFMSSLLIAFAIAVAHSSRSSSFAACSKYSTFSLVVILKTP